MESISGQIKRSETGITSFFKSMCAMLALARQFGLTIEKANEAINANKNTESN